MRLGADPDQLERLGRSHRAAGRELDRVRVSLVRRTDRSTWSGPAARQWSGTVRSAIVPSLVAAARSLDRAAADLVRHAESQRLASLALPATTTIRTDRAGDGRWVGRTGSTTASVVIVLVPGVGTAFDDVPRLRSDAARVWSAVAARSERTDRLGAGGSEQVAVVSWLGYDPPDTVLGGIDPRPASAGATGLVADVAMLRRQGAQRVVVVGHSYGSLLAARAAADGLGADELVMLGAPGLGVGTVAGLDLAVGADLWAARAKGDLVSWIAGAGLVHGPDPVPLARRLPTSGSGHGSYLHDPVLLAALADLALARGRGEPVPSPS